MQAKPEDFQYEVLETADGSPTIRLWKSSQDAECMHHLGGALTESLYIYDQAIVKAMGFQSPLNILSVGLGLGYNELIAVARAMRDQFSLEQFKMDSYEIEDRLRDHFLLWLNESVELPPLWIKLYDSILDSIAKHFEILPGLIKMRLLELFENEQWRLFSELDADTTFTGKYNCILFDAFSKGATPNLWDEEFLKNFLEKVSGKQCVLSTYAATGSLKRALRDKSFEVDLRPGFQGKRQSTWAVKNN